MTAFPISSTHQLVKSLNKTLYTFADLPSPPPSDQAAYDNKYYNLCVIVVRTTSTIPLIQERMWHSRFNPNGGGGNLPAANLNLNNFNIQANDLKRLRKI